MWLGAARECADKDQKIGDPDDDEPQNGVPFGLGIFVTAGDAEQIARAGDDDEEVIAEDHEPRRKIAGEPGAASALHDVERGREQNIAAESENDRGRVKRPQPSEIDEGQIEIESGKSQLESNVKADGKAGDAPKH